MSTQESTVPVAPSEAGSISVVLADDEPDVRLLLRLQLETAGFDVVGEASDGEEAVLLCEQLAPGAIVLDLLMPKTNGFEAIPRLRRLKQAPGIVAYTAVAGDFVRKEMERLEIPLLLKSGDVAPLTEALRSVATR